MPSLSIFAPAKLNLFLAITGRRTDGYHDLVSLVAPLDFGDTLEVTPADELILACHDPAVPCDATNLVLRAAAAFAKAANYHGGARFFLRKRIPLGAGLGGGSSDGVAALKAMNELAGRPLGAEALAELAAGLGSDCPLFLQNGPCILRGRGEKVEALPGPAAERLRGRRAIVFKPAFPIGTAWAYAQLAAANVGRAGRWAQPAAYLPAAEAEARLSRWLADPAAPPEAILFNTLERVAFTKFLALPELILHLRQQYGVAAQMSGSGSACFVLLDAAAPAEPLLDAIRAAWGPSVFAIEGKLA